MWLCIWMCICAHMGKMIGMLWRGYSDRNSVRRFSNCVCFFLPLFLFIPLVLIACSSHSSSSPCLQTPCLFPLSRENPSLSCLYSLPYVCSDVDYSLLINDLTANNIHIQMNTYSICLSGSVLPHSWWYFLVLFIYLWISLSHFLLND